MSKKTYYGNSVKKKKKVSKNLVWTLISLLLAILTIRMVFKQSRDISVDDLIRVIGSSNRPVFVIAVAAAGLYVWFEGAAICSILKHTGNPRGPLNGLLYSTADVYFSAITPSATGGQPASSFFMIRDGIPAGVATATLILNLMMYTASIIVLGLVSILLSPNAFWGFSDAAKIIIALGFAALSVLVALFFILLRKEHLLFSLVSRLILFLYKKRVIREKDRKLSKLEEIRSEYKICAALISGRKRILFGAFFWNLIQRTSQLMVPMLVFAALGGEKVRMAGVFSKQCLVTIGYNFVPVPGGMGISDYLMIDGFSRIMGEQMAFNVDLISRGLTFYVCVTISGIITLIGYFAGRNRK